MAFSKKWFDHHLAVSISKSYDQIIPSGRLEPNCHRLCRFACSWSAHAHAGDCVLSRMSYFKEPKLWPAVFWSKSSGCWESILGRLWAMQSRWLGTDTRFTQEMLLTISLYIWYLLTRFPVKILYVQGTTGGLGWGRHQFRCTCSACQGVWRWRTHDGQW